MYTTSAPHPDFGHVVDDDGILVVIDWRGDERRMGSLPDKFDPVLSVPIDSPATTNLAFEDLLAAEGIELTDAQIEEIARSGVMDGRPKFGGQFIDNQNNHGSCNGYMEAGMLACARYRRGEPLELLSGAYAYSLMNGGRDQGSQLAHAMANVSDRGICRKQLCDWRQIYPSMYNRAVCDADAKRFRGFLQYPCRTLRGFWTGLALGFDGGCAVHAARNFMRVNADGIAGVDSGPGNHAVRCDGLIWTDFGPTGTGDNSWGLEYGDGGRMQLHTGHFNGTFRNHQFWILPSTVDDPDDANKPPRLAVATRAPRLVSVS